MESSFDLTLHATYFDKGFFNVPVRCDERVRQSDGPIFLTLLPGNRELVACVNRRANLNHTPRIMGGTGLRDWFQNNAERGGTVEVTFRSAERATLRIV